jgi:hypothetical protein
LKNSTASWGSPSSDSSKKALEISGAKDVVIYFSTPIEEGKGYSELSIAWR